MDTIEEIKSRLDIVSFISEYITLSRAGRNFKAVCPFHKEKTPSFIVSPELQIWRCFGACGEGGDVFKFLMKIENLEFPEAVRILAQKTGVKIVSRGIPASEREKFYEINGEALRFYNYILKSHSLGNLARSYLKRERGLEDRTIDVFGVGFAPESRDSLQKYLAGKKKYAIEDLGKCGLIVTVEDGGKNKIVDRFRGRIVFPLRDPRGNVLGFSGRVLPKDERKGAGKYVNTPETAIYHKRQHVFGVDVGKDEIKNREEVVVVEGEFDVMSCWQAGFKNVVAIKGSSFTQEQARLLSRFTDKVVLALDRDEAGFEAAKTGLGIAEREGLTVRIADLGSFKDPDEAVRADFGGFEQKLNGALDAYDYFIERAFQKYNPRTSEGVRRISQELVPLFGNIRDNIVKAHYAQKISDKLGISQEAVFSQMQTNEARSGTAAAPPPAQKKTRRELLEESIVSLSLAARPDFILDSRFETLLTDNALRRIRNGAREFLKKNKKFSTQKFIKSLPPELVDKTTALALDPLNAGLSEAGSLRELDRIAEELEVLVIQERINQLTSLIREKERKRETIIKEREELARLITMLSHDIIGHIWPKSEKAQKS